MISIASHRVKTASSCSLHISLHISLELLRLGLSACDLRRFGFTAQELEIFTPLELVRAGTVRDNQSDHKVTTCSKESKQRHWCTTGFSDNELALAGHPQRLIEVQTWVGMCFFSDAFRIFSEANSFWELWDRDLHRPAGCLRFGNLP